MELERAAILEVLAQVGNVRFRGGIARADLDVSAVDDGGREIYKKMATPLQNLCKPNILGLSCFEGQFEWKWLSCSCTGQGKGKARRGRTYNSNEQRLLIASYRG
jgi:hypothetical protein